MAAKRKRQNISPPAVIDNTVDLQVDYMTALETDPKYSLDVDPENKYSLSETHKNFIRYYIDFRNINTAAELAGIDMDTAKEFFTAYSTQTEIRRINMALYQRQFANKILGVDQLGGYLSSLLTDAYTPLANQLTTNDKLRVVDMLLKINDMKKNAFDDPAVIIEKDVNEQLKELSVDALKELIYQTSTNTDKKVELIDKLDIDNILTLEEKAYLQTLSTQELLKLINETSSIKKEQSHE